jgi:hypothetical protein
MCRRFLARNKRALSAVLFTSIFWLSCIHALLFFFLQSDLPVCLTSGTDCFSQRDREELSRFDGQSYYQSDGVRKYASFFNQLVTSNETTGSADPDDDTLQAWKDEVPDHVLKVG